MRSLRSSALVVGSSLALASGALAQQAVQWRVEDGGNGHWYRLVATPKRLTIATALNAASLAGGGLASIGSQAENEFVFALASADPSLWTLAWPGATQITGPWIGASYVAGSWSWIDGAEWSYSSWAPTEPNYLNEETAVLFMGLAGSVPTALWNNIQPDYLNWGYMIEWSSDCNGDGIVDYGQTVSGELPDLDGDHVPDCCEQGTTCSPAPTQWSIAAGGNGHWYQLVVPPVRVSALDASLAARARGGELASIGGAFENDFVFSLANTHPSLWVLAWPGATQITGPWLGAVYTGSTWTWSDTSPWTFANWAPSEPNYLFEETSVHFMGGAAGRPSTKWNNNRPDYLNWGYMVEWSSDCNGDGLVDFGQIRSGELRDSNFDGVPDCCEAGNSCDACVADVDLSGSVDGGDLAVVLNTWGTDGGGYPRADIDGSGTVDGADLAQLLNAWGTCPR